MTTAHDPPMTGHVLLAEALLRQEHFSGVNRQHQSISIDKTEREKNVEVAKQAEHLFRPHIYRYTGNVLDAAREHGTIRG